MTTAYTTWADFEAEQALAMRRMARQLGTEYADIVSAAFIRFATIGTQQITNCASWTLTAVRNQIRHELHATLPSFAGGDPRWYAVGSLNDISIEIAGEEVEPGAAEIDMRIVDAALQRVPEPLWTVARSALEGLSERQIADKLGIKSGATVHKQITRICDLVAVNSGQPDLFGLEEECDHGA